MTKHLLILWILAFAALFAAAASATAADTVSTNGYKTLQHSDNTSTTYRVSVLPREQGPSVSSRPPQDPLAQRLVADGHLRRASAICEHVKCREALVADLNAVGRRLKLDSIRARQ